jgi:hypothetical protein
VAQPFRAAEPGRAEALPHRRLWTLGIVGSPDAASWIDQTAFVVLMVRGLVSGELSAKTATMFVLIWLAGFIGRDHVPYGVALFPSGVDVVNRPADFQVPQEQFTVTLARSLSNSHVRLNKSERD